MLASLIQFALSQRLMTCLLALLLTLGAILGTVVAIALVVALPVVLKFLGLGTLAEGIVRIATWRLSPVRSRTSFITSRKGKTL